MGEKGVMFYSNGGSVVGVDHNWVQESFYVIVELFERVGLKNYGNKTKFMV